MSWPPKDGAPYMPSNGTEGLGFEENWCAACVRERAFYEWDGRGDPPSGCPIRMSAYVGEQPEEWQWRDEAPTCTAFESKSEADEKLRRESTPGTDEYRERVESAGQAKLPIS